jgi:hypothetical protein
MTHARIGLFARYCECYQAGVPCSEKCKCKECRNTYGFPPLFIASVAHRYRIRMATGLASSTSALGLGPSLPTSAPRLRSPLPHLHRKRLRSNRHEDRRTGLSCSPCGLRSPTISEARAEGPSRRRVGNCPNAEACGIICTRLRSSPFGLFVCTGGRPWAGINLARATTSTTMTKTTTTTRQG